MEQYGGNNNFGPQATGYYYNPQQAKPRIQDFLTPDERKQLAQQGNEFSLQMTKEEKLKALCRHRSDDGTRDIIIEGPDGVCTCQRCGYKFRTVDPNSSPKDLKDSVDTVIDILQTIKTIYIDMNPDAAREFFQIIALLNKIPDLFQYAVQDYLKHEPENQYNYSVRNMNVWSMFDNIARGGFNQSMGMGQPMGQPMYGAPMMGQPMGQPMYNGAPMMGQQPMYGAPSNGFVAGMPTPQMQQPQAQQQYVPQTPNGYSYTPNQNQQAPTQATTVPTTTQPVASAPDNGTVNVQTEFKV